MQGFPDRQVLWLNVHDGSDGYPFTPSGVPWCRELHSTFALRKGERIAVLRTVEDRKGSMHEDVVDTYRDHDGSLNVTVRPIMVDPTPAASLVNSNELRRGEGRPGAAYHSIWFTDRDGNLEERLRESGWLPYVEHLGVHGPPVVRR